MKSKVIFLLYRMFWIFPIKRNRIVFSSFDCRKYGGNPKAISDFLHKMDQCDLIWILDKDVQADIPVGIKRINVKSIKKIYYYATAKVWVDSHHFYNRYKRNGQFLIQTWHAACALKKLEGDCLEYFDPRHIRQVRKCSEMTDYQMTNNDIGRRDFGRAMWYFGPILQFGMPSNDILVNLTSTQVAILRKKLGIKDDVHCALYAPTCRQKDEMDMVNVIDYSGVVSALKERFGGGQWCILYRGHPIADENKKERLDSECAIDVTYVNDVSELLAISDVLITDYSSISIDYLCTKRPVFIFAYDYVDYSEKRNFNFDLRKLPFLFSTTNEELKNNILQFSLESYLDSLELFMKSINYSECGNATERICNIISRICQKTES